MKISWKGIVILAVLLVSIFYDVPTLLTFLPQEQGDNERAMQALLTQTKEMIDPIKGLDLALADSKKRRIQILTDGSTSFSIENKILQGILNDEFTLSKEGEDVYLTLGKNADPNIFISEIAGKLNALFTNVRKIKEVKLTEDQSALVFIMEEEKRLSPKSEPLKTVLGERLEVSYQPGKSQYVSREKTRENVVSLGLDLQGGMYLDIGVESEAVVKSVLDKLADDIENILIDDNINYESVSRITDSEVELLLEAGEEFDLFGEKYTRLLGDRFDTLPKEDGFIITLNPEEVKRLKEKAIEQALETIRNRIDQLGVKEPSIQRQGEDSIVIQLPGLKDPDQARRVIARVAVLNFMIVADQGSVEAPEDGQVVLYEEIRDSTTKELLTTKPYLIENKVLLKGSRIRDARVGFEQTGTGAYVGMSFDEVGKDEFATITEENVGRLLAIVLDGKVQSAPRINEKIPGGEAQITGSFTPEEATELALVLRSGALPAPIVVHEERTVGASLGEDSVRKALISLTLGFACLILFMMFYYRMAGIFSVLALIFNLLLIVSALAYFQATLTLPGMAGIILTIGMAVDANVLIFERIREELNRGSPIRASINTGFQKATITILDSNITTILAAIVLFQFGTGPIKGFAVTLSIGILASMFTSIFVGRFLFEVVYLNRKNLDTISI